MPIKGSLFDLIKTARLDRGLTHQKVAQEIDVSVDSLQKLENGQINSFSTAALSRLEEVLKLPDGTLLQGYHDPASLSLLHRSVVYQRFITPAGLDEWVDLLFRLAEAYLIGDEIDSHAVAYLRKEVEKKLEKRVLFLLEKDEISQGRAKELLNLSPWDDLPNAKR